MQAVERAISELTRLQKPLRTESDVTELSMGARSKEKVLEIMETGTLRQNEILAADEQQQVIQLVSMSMMPSLYRLSCNGGKTIHSCCDGSGACLCELTTEHQAFCSICHVAHRFWPRCFGRHGLTANEPGSVWCAVPEGMGCS